jgi:ABC-type branched-subunit amino acid transport system substrate-binding protein
MEEQQPIAGGASPTPAPKSRKTLWAVLAVVVIVVVVLVAAVLAGFFNPAPSKVTTLVIGTVLSLTGTSGLEVFGPKNLRGADLARDEINAAGGVLGNPIQIVSEDDAGVPATATARAQLLINTNHVSAILGAVGSSFCQAVLAVAKANSVVEISASCTSPIFDNLTYTGGWFFRTAPSDALQGVVAASYAYNNRSLRNVAVIGNDNSYGRGLANVFATKFTALGGKAQVFIFPLTQTTYTSQLTALFQAFSPNKPDAIYMAEYPTDGLKVLRDWAANSGWSGVSWIFSEGVLDQSGFVDLLNAQGLNNVTIQAMQGSAPGAYLGIVGSNYNGFLSRYKAAYSGQDPGLFTANAYDAVYLLAAAAEYAGDASSSSIQGAIRTVSGPSGAAFTGGQWSAMKAALDSKAAVNYEGASGSVNLDKYGDPASGYAIWGINATNQIYTVAYYPESLVNTIVASSLSLSVHSATFVTQLLAASVEGRT